jgi:hypothetical protein
MHVCLPALNEFVLFAVMRLSDVGVADVAHVAVLHADINRLKRAAVFKTCIRAFAVSSRTSSERKGQFSEAYPGMI